MDMSLLTKSYSKVPADKRQTFLDMDEQARDDLADLQHQIDTDPDFDYLYLIEWAKKAKVKIGYKRVGIVLCLLAEELVV